MEYFIPRAAVVACELYELGRKKKYMAEKLTYQEAAHGVQTGIAFELEHGSDCASPKHLRVGINMGKADMAGLVMLLIKKGVITEEEYIAAITDSANDELAFEEKIVNDKYGAGGRIKLR